MLTRELATSTPIVPTTMRWIHCLAASADFDSTAVIFQMKAKMNESAPIDPTRAWPMWIQVLMRLVIGVMSGSPARKPCAPPGLLEAGYLSISCAGTPVVKNGYVGEIESLAGWNARRQFPGTAGIEPILRATRKPGF